MNVSSVSINWTLPTSATGAKSAAPCNDGDGNDGERVQRGSHRPGGAVGEAAMSALQSLGISLPPPPGGPPPDGSSSDSSTDSGSSISSSGASSTGDIGSDVRKLMHALFEAVRSEQSSAGSSSSSASSSNSSGSQSASFASGLSTLISQVSSGSAPSDLQSAFDQLVSDAGALAGNSSSTASASLQDFLRKLQSNLGYDASGTSTSGNLLATQA